jgi:hypothetical protein
VELVGIDELISLHQPADSSISQVFPSYAVRDHAITKQSMLHASQTEGAKGPETGAVEWGGIVKYQLALDLQCNWLSYNHQAKFE